LTEEDFARDLAIQVAELKKDQLNALKLLAGHVVRTRTGIEKIKYLKPTEEKTGRQSLARLFRREIPALSYELRHTLAALFDPEPNTFPGGERKLRFQRRTSGNPYDSTKKAQIAEFVKVHTAAAEKQKEHSERLRVRWDKRRTFQSIAVKEASIAFGIDTRRVLQILKGSRQLESVEEPKVIFYRRVVEE
jgi:hypothetical protein